MFSSVKMANTIDAIKIGKIEKIKGKVTDLTEVKTKNRSKYFNFWLRDETGVVAGVCFIAKKHDEMINDKTYEFENIIANDNDILRAAQLKIINETIITSAEEEIEKCAKPSTTKLSDIVLGINTNIVGVYTYISEIENRTSKQTNKSLTIRKVEIVDETAKVCVNTWNDHFNVQLKQINFFLIIVKVCVNTWNDHFNFQLNDIISYIKRVPLLHISDRLQ